MVARPPDRVAAKDWRNRPPCEAAALFRALRETSLVLWRRLAPSELSRTGLHRGAGARLSLGQTRDILAGHDLVHLDQIREGLGV